MQLIYAIAKKGCTLVAQYRETDVATEGSTEAAEMGTTGRSPLPLHFQSRMISMVLAAQTCDNQCADELAMLFELGSCSDDAAGPQACATLGGTTDGPFQFSVQQ